jgi:hypothetical protein
LFPFHLALSGWPDEYVKKSHKMSPSTLSKKLIRICM